MLLVFRFALIYYSILYHLCITFSYKITGSSCLHPPPWALEKATIRALCKQQQRLKRQQPSAASDFLRGETKRLFPAEEVAILSQFLTFSYLLALYIQYPYSILFSFEGGGGSPDAFRDRPCQLISLKSVLEKSASSVYCEGSETPQRKKWKDFGKPVEIRVLKALNRGMYIFEPFKP